MNVGVDRHLLAGHRVEREARRDFGDALRAARDHDELDRHEDRKDDQPDDQVSAHDELAERGNDRADRARRRARRQDQPRRRNVEREAKQRRDQQRRRERRELERIVDGDREQQHERRPEDVDAQQHVEQPRRQRHDQNADDRQQQGGEGVDRALARVHGPSGSPATARPRRPRRPRRSARGESARPYAPSRKSARASATFSTIGMPWRFARARARATRSLVGRAHEHARHGNARRPILERDGDVRRIGDDEGRLFETPPCRRAATPDAASAGGRARSRRPLLLSLRACALRSSSAACAATRCAPRRTRQPRNRIQPRTPPPRLRARPSTPPPRRRAAPMPASDAAALQTTNGAIAALAHAKAQRSSQRVRRASRARECA